MPSPFPGMDPYLEEPGLWPDVHLNLISGIQGILGRHLRPKYSLRVEDRVYISDENDPGRRVIVPDIEVLAIRETEFHPPPPGTAVGVVEPVVMTTLIEDEIREPRIRVIDRETRQVVTVIEVLSPTNKVAGSRGRRSYETKRQEVMSSETHFVEIDLLRTGERFFTKERMPECEYAVHVSKKARRPEGWIWPIRLSQRLPLVAIPLRAEDPDASLDLQEVLSAAYDKANYDLDIDYTRPPVPPLPGPWAEWSDRLLREKRPR